MTCTPVLGKCGLVRPACNVPRGIYAPHYSVEGKPHEGLQAPNPGLGARCPSGRTLNVFVKPKDPRELAHLAWRENALLRTHEYNHCTTKQRLRLAKSRISQNNALLRTRYTTHDFCQSIFPSPPVAHRALRLVVLPLPQAARGGLDLGDYRNLPECAEDVAQQADTFALLPPPLLLRGSGAGDGTPADLALVEQGRDRGHPHCTCHGHLHEYAHARHRPQPHHRGQGRGHRVCEPSPLRQHRTHPLRRRSLHAMSAHHRPRHAAACPRQRLVRAAGTGAHPARYGHRHGPCQRRGPCGKG